MMSSDLMTLILVDTSVPRIGLLASQILSVDKDVSQKKGAEPS